ncbi:hypothetical protein [Streptomyces sp. NPDC001404]|uniref:hypothetical protein n=1 Tax=Streptomyces sp. NPDC001404 TaxID=3364571 RepID=UPI0036A2E6E5
MTEASVYVATLSLRQVPFANKADAEVLVERWNADHAESVDRLRAEGLDRLADRSIAKLEEWPRERWAHTGPGGMNAVWTRVPGRRLVHHALAAYKADGSLARESRWTTAAWEFESDTYTIKAAEWKVEHRPGADAESEASARGTDEAAVDVAFMKAREEVLRICGQHRFANGQRRHL